MPIFVPPKAVTNLKQGLYSPLFPQRLELFESLRKVDSSFLNWNFKDKISFLVYGFQSATSKSSNYLISWCFLVNSDFYTMWLSIDIFQVLMLCAVFIVSTCLYWMLCPTFFINVFYLVLFCIHVCVDTFMENKQTNKQKNRFEFIF